MADGIKHSVCKTVSIFLTFFHCLCVIDCLLVELYLKISFSTNFFIFEGSLCTTCVFIGVERLVNKFVCIVHLQEGLVAACDPGGQIVILKMLKDTSEEKVSLLTGSLICCLRLEIISLYCSFTHFLCLHY